MHVFGNATVHTHDFFVNESYEWHMIEAIIELLPQFDQVPPLNFVEKSINSRNSLTLMVSSQNNYLLWISYFQGEEEAYDLTALFSSIYIITHEEVLSALGNDIITLLLLILFAHLLEHVEQVRILAVYITKYFYRCLELD